MRNILVVVAMAATVLASTASQAAEAEGVHLSDTVTFQGAQLKLNGYGVRTKFLFSVCVVALYLEAPSKDGAAILAANQAIQVRTVFLRSIGKEKLQEGIREGFKRRSGADLPRYQDRLNTLLPAIPDVSSGDEVDYTYVPGKGTTVSVRRLDKVVIGGKDFALMLFSGFVGENASDAGLRDRLLGK
jgi:hypothetical protein